jgi:hypothetical protein
MNFIKKYDWHLVGWIPIVFGIISYFFGLSNHVPLCSFLWVCPLAAILSGIAVLLRNNFFISASIMWIIGGPLVVLLASPKQVLQLWHVHHLVSVIMLVIILYNFKKIWNPKGFAFGLTIFYAYIGITSYFSNGMINFACEWWGVNKIILGLAVFFAVLSVALLVWDFVENKYVLK